MAFGGSSPLMKESKHKRVGFEVMAWKVMHRGEGTVVKLGLGSEEAAQDWLDQNPDLQVEDYIVAEMDDEELTEWEESLEEAENEDVPDDFEEQYSAYTDPDGEAGDVDDKDLFDNVVDNEDI